jgi:hypothetical protein
MGTTQMASKYETRVKGHLPQHWPEWLEGLAIIHHRNGETVLSGSLRDQAALLGVVMKVRDLGLTLLSVNPIDGATERPPARRWYWRTLARRRPLYRERSTDPQSA